MKDQPDMPFVGSVAYLPPVSFFMKASHCNGILIEQHENYNRQTYRNRCRIPGPNGILTLSIPVRHQSGQKIPIREVLIDNREAWQRQHWRSITSAYNKSPFFLFYMDSFCQFYEDPAENLFDFNMGLLHLCLNLLKFNTDITFTQKFKEEGKYPNDYRFKLSPKKDPPFALPVYPQVFSERYPFAPDMSIIDLLFNEGPLAANLLVQF